MIIQLIAAVLLAVLVWKVVRWSRKRIAGFTRSEREEFDAYMVIWGWLWKVMAVIVAFFVLILLALGAF